MKGLEKEKAENIFKSVKSICTRLDRLKEVRVMSSYLMATPRPRLLIVLSGRSTSLVDRAGGAAWR